MKKIVVIVILVLFLIFIISDNSLAGEYKIYTNTDQIYFEITSPENDIRSNDISVEIYNNKENKLKKELFLHCSDLIDKEGNIISANELNINILNNQYSSKTYNKVLLNKYEGEILFNLILSQAASYYPPGEYHGNLIIGDGIYNLPIFLKISPFAQVSVNKEKVHFNLLKPAQNISNKEVIEINVDTNLENWNLKLEFPQGIVHEDGKCSFPLEQIICNKVDYNLENQNVNYNNFENPQLLNVTYFDKKVGKYNLKLNIWADIRDDWNCVLAGEYTGEIYFTFINNN